MVDIGTSFRKQTRERVGSLLADGKQHHICPHAEASMWLEATKMASEGLTINFSLKGGTDFPNWFKLA